MLTMSQINDIRDLRRMGYNISKISSITGRDRKTITKYLGQDDFSPEPPVAVPDFFAKKSVFPPKGIEQRPPL